MITACLAVTVVSIAITVHRSAHAPRSATIAAACRTTGTGLYLRPDRRMTCTPGVWISSRIPTRAQVCTPGYNPRPPESATRPLKLQAIKLYGVDGKNTESDHLFPVWLGGATDVRNLWPEPNYPTADQTRFVHNPKDALELKIYADVCRSRTLTVGHARRIFEGDWRRAYRRYDARRP